MSTKVTVAQQQPITVKVKTGAGSGLDQFARNLANSAYNEANSRARYAFSTINVATQNNITADSNSDTLTIIQGTGILIQTDNVNGSVTIAATGGAAFDQFARDKANGAVQIGYTEIQANGTSLIPDTNASILVITSVQANGIRIEANSTTDTIDIGLTPTGIVSGIYGNSNTIISITVDQFGRITGASNVSPSFNASVLSSGVLSVIRGGTGFSSFSNGQILIGNNGTLDRSNLVAGPGIVITQNTTSVNISSNIILPIQSKSVSYGYPLLNETITLFYTNTAIVFNEVRSVVAGTSPNITFKLFYTDSRSNITGTPILSSVNCQNVTTGISNTTFNNSSVPANNYICLTVLDKIGTVDELAATMFFSN